MLASPWTVDHYSMAAIALDIGHLYLVGSCGPRAVTLFAERFSCGVAFECIEDCISVLCITAGGDREAVLNKISKQPDLE